MFGLEKNRTEMHLRCGRLLLATGFVASLAVVAPAGALAAQLIGRNATNVHLSIDKQGVALITYTSGGKVSHVLARGAINALPRSKSRPQVKFKLDYTGGLGFYHRAVWKKFAGSCGRYDGPTLYGMVAACKAPDGSYWALQSWQEALPDLGFTPWTAEQRSWWLELSHWTGPLAQLDIWQAFAQSQHNAIFGTYTYEGKPIYGYGTTKYGVPTDDYGRLVYLDTFGSDYGHGWLRENSFVSRGPVGEFCYAFVARNPHIGGYQLPPDFPRSGATRGPGTGTRYRVIAQGPGVTPIVSWQGDALHTYDRENPADVVLAVRNIERLRALAPGNSCLRGQSMPASFGLASQQRALIRLADDFRSGLSAQWATPQTAGGASLATGPSGLVMSFVSGQQGSVELTSAGKREVKLSPAFIDLGVAGIPTGVEFGLALLDKGGIGVRIANGDLQLVKLASSSDSLAQATPLTAGIPYDPASMRWLFIWAGPPQAPSDASVQVYYAGDANGPWTRAFSFGIGSNWAIAGHRLGILATSDGTGAATVTVGALNH